MFGQWQTVVGEQIAEHATPTALRDGVLSVSAESTAWATQLRMVQAQLLAKIAAAVGDGVVTSLKITGPVGAVVAQGTAGTSPAGGRATHTADGPALSAESRQNAATSRRQASRRTSDREIPLHGANRCARNAASESVLSPFTGRLC